MRINLRCLSSQLRGLALQQEELEQLPRLRQVLWLIALIYQVLKVLRVAVPIYLDVILERDLLRVLIEFLHHLLHSFNFLVWVSGHDIVVSLIFQRRFFLFNCLGD